MCRPIGIETKIKKTQVTEGDWNYVDVLIKVGHWMLEYSSCDPQQCWFETLEVMDGRWN